MECIKIWEYGIINDGIYDEKEGILEAQHWPLIHTISFIFSICVPTTLTLPP